MRILILVLLSTGVAVAHDFSKTMDLPVPVVTGVLENTLVGAYSTSYVPETSEDDLIGRLSGEYTAYGLRVSNADAVLDALAEIQETQEAEGDVCNTSRWLTWSTYRMPAPVQDTRFLVSMEIENRVIRETDTCAPCFRDPNGQDADGNDCIDDCMDDPDGYAFWMGGYLQRDGRWYSWDWLKRDHFPVGLSYFADRGWRLEQTDLLVRFHFRLQDRANCSGRHVKPFAPGRHGLKRHDYTEVIGPASDWIWARDLVAGTVAVDAPSDPEEESDTEVEEPADNVDELARLRTENADLQSDLSAVRDSVDALLAGAEGEIITLYDTVEVATHDTLLYCPPSDEERQDLFDEFTGADDDTTNTDGAGKVSASVRVESWGAIKALVGSD